MNKEKKGPFSLSQDSFLGGALGTKMGHLVGVFSGLILIFLWPKSHDLEKEKASTFQKTLNQIYSYWPPFSSSHFCSRSLRNKTILLDGKPLFSPFKYLFF